MSWCTRKSAGTRRDGISNDHALILAQMVDEMEEDVQNSLQGYCTLPVVREHPETSGDPNV